MCSRYSLNADFETIREALGAPNLSLDSRLVLPFYNIAPTHVAPIITIENQSSLTAGKFGISGAPQSLVINARSESITDKLPFSRLVNSQRCLILATGYIEWTVAGKFKSPHLITLPNGGLMRFAGVYQSSNGNIDQIEFVILTKPSNPSVAAIHDRMPVILSDSQAESWLSTKRYNSIVSDTVQEGKHAQCLISTKISRQINAASYNLKDALEPERNQQMDLFE